MSKPNNMSMAKGERTSLSKANSGSYSLRTTVPTGIVKQLDLKEGSSILWKLIPNGKNFMIIVEPEYNPKKNKRVKK